MTRDRDGGAGESGNGEVTHLLARWADGDRAALDALTPIVYGELRKIADAYPPARTQRPYAAAHGARPRGLAAADEAGSAVFRSPEAVLRARRADDAAHPRRSRPRRERREARRRRATGRPSIRPPVDIGAGRIVEFLALDQALTQLARVSARQAQVIEMRYFAGLNLDEISGLLGVSPATISRDQRTAEAWLSHVMADRPHDSDARGSRIAGDDVDPRPHPGILAPVGRALHRRAGSAAARAGGVRRARDSR